jgi:serine/threonine-protein kinase
LHEAVTGTLPFKSDSTVAALSARVGRLMPVSADLGPLASVLERAGRPEADERATAAEFGKGLLQVASKMPRPEPLPLLSSGLFDTPPEDLRSPDDPTGGVVRRSEAAVAPLVVVPIDEPDERHVSEGEPSDPVAGDEGSEGLAADLDDDVTATMEGDELVILPLDADPEAGTRQPDDPAMHAEPAPVTAAAGVTTQQIAIAADAEVEQPPRRRRRFPWKILLGLLVVGALVALGILALQLFRRPTYLVPDLTGMPVAEARNLVAPNDWEIDEQGERSDDVPTVGQVVRTAPAAGVELAEGEPFLMVVSEGPLLRELPDSTGRPLSEAQTALAALRLGVETIEQFDEVVPPGTVISWSVPGDATLSTGSMVEPETVVQLVVSTGPAPRVVPNLAGRPLAEVRSELEAMGLVLRESEQVFSDDVVLGSIVAQNIAEGTEVPRGSEVLVAVSRGPDLVIYPDLTGAATFEQAAAILSAAGFQPVLTFGDAQGAIQSVSIAGETPATGETYRRGTVVEFTAI